MSSIKSTVSGPGIKGVALYDSHTESPLRMAIVDGVIRVPTSDPRGSKFYQNVGEGALSEYSIVYKFGKNEAVGTTLVPVCFGGVYQMPQVANATTLRIKAGNANDTAAGTGAREITLIGMDETGAEITVLVATAGASASSNTTEKFLRLDRAYVSASGTYPTAINIDSQTATIVIENSAGSADWLTINAKMAQSHVAAYAIPLGKIGYINSIISAVDSNKAYDLHLFIRENILETAVPYSGFRIHAHIVGLQDPLVWNVKTPLGPFPALTDIVWAAKVGTGTADISVDFEVLLKDA